MGFLKFLIDFKYLGIVLAFVGLIVFARFRSFSQDTGKSTTVQKAIGIGLFALGMIWILGAGITRLVLIG